MVPPGMTEASVAVSVAVSGAFTVTVLLAETGTVSSASTVAVWL